MESKLCIGLFVILCFAWQTNATVTCTAAGRYADPDDTTCQNYTLCVSSSGSFIAYNYVCPTTSLFDPTTSKCTTDYVCNSTSTTNTTSSVCTSEGYVANPNSTNCTTYIQCIADGDSYDEYELTCPDDTYFNPNTTNCESDYNCTTSSTFTCTAAGRYADSSDTTCQTYYLCVEQTDGTFEAYEYTCPSTSLFSPTSKVCTTSYTCSS